MSDKNNLKKIMISLPKVCHDKDLSASQIKMLKSPQVGGVLLFADNFDENISQVKKLIQALNFMETYIKKILVWLVIIVKKLLF